MKEYIERGVFNVDVATSEVNAISAGNCHTIPGTKPIYVLCRNNNASQSSPKCSFHSFFQFFLDCAKQLDQRIDHEILSKGIVKCCQILRIDLVAENNCSGKTVILLSNNISSRKILDSLREQRQGNLMLYDDGVDMFDTWNVPKYYNCSKSEKKKQKEDVRNWIDRGGILLTHSQQFRGCESTNVVLVFSSLLIAPE